MKKSESCLPVSRYRSHLIMDTWKETLDLITVREDHVMGDRVFSWQQLMRRFTKLGSWEQWDREGQRWMSRACWPRSITLDYTFLPEESVACIAGKHFHLWWRSSWDVFSSDEGMERSWDLTLQCWASVLLATLTRYGAPALPASSEIQRLHA